MEKIKFFADVKFNPDIIRHSRDSLIPPKREGISLSRPSMRIHMADNTIWHHDSEDEFFADYRRGHNNSTFEQSRDNQSIEVYFENYSYSRGSRISVAATSREIVERVFHIFESAVASCTLPPKPKDNPSEIVQEKPIQRIFIGHGRNQQWKELKDHLHEKHEFHIEAYESGARAGHTIRDILQQMINPSSVAILVMTGEDIDIQGKHHARDNVIHELGLFQGALGFSKAIILLEEGTEEFSNIHGTTQIRYNKGNIKETFGEVVATLRQILK